MMKNIEKFSKKDQVFVEKTITKTFEEFQILCKHCPKINNCTEFDECAFNYGQSFSKDKIRRAKSLLKIHMQAVTTPWLEKLVSILEET